MTLAFVAVPANGSARGSDTRAERGVDGKFPLSGTKPSSGKPSAASVAARRSERAGPASYPRNSRAPTPTPEPPARRRPRRHRTGRSAPPSHSARRAASPPTSTQVIPPGPASLPDGSAMPGSRAMKNGSSGSAIASATPVSRAVSPDREMPVTSMPSRFATGRHVFDRDGPREQAVAVPAIRRLDRRAERRARRLVGVRDREQLEVAAAERHDAVVRADAGRGARRRAPRRRSRPRPARRRRRGRRSRR